MFKDNNINKAIYEIKNKLFYVKIRDIFSISLLLIAVPYALLLKITKKNVWLVCERKSEARDNGYVFFKYVLDHTNVVNIYYAIDKKSDDYNKLRYCDKKIISFGSIKHMAYYLTCDAVISTVKNCGPNDLMGFLFRKLNIKNNKIYFIQHGITKDNLDWLHYSATKFHAITCGAYPEYEFISENFGYPKNRVIFTGGMCRYDYLHNSDIPSQKYILVMPTWRKWLKCNNPQIMKIEHTDIFTESNYFKNWIEFIHDEEIISIVRKNGFKVVFYLHPTMQYYIDEFKSSSNDVIIADEKQWDIQTLIKSASILITDYSSVFFDFIYMKKPIIFYQFDVDVFRKFHYSEGYFHYDNNSFSNAVYSIGELTQKLENAINHNFSVSNEYLREHKKYFPLYDTKNSERTFNEIYKNVYKKASL